MIIEAFLCSPYGGTKNLRKNILFYKDRFGGNIEDGLEDEKLESEKPLRRLLH